MVESSSPQKMFVLELDMQAGSGTYRVNQDAMRMILDDLQMFKDYVKPFSFSGNPTHAIILDKHLGKVTKQGAYWVVEAPLEMSIS